MSPELWRCVGPFALDGVLPDFERVLRQGDEAERRGAALALLASPLAAARALVATEMEIAAEIARGNLTWDRLGG